LIIKLQRALEPSVMEETECAHCTVPFRVESVLVVDERLGDDPFVCLSCLDYLHKRNPQEFPSVEDYRSALRRYPEPVFETVEEIIRLEDAEDWEALERVHEEMYIAR
jgi:hypothetical protein